MMHTSSLIASLVLASGVVLTTTGHKLEAGPALDASAIETDLMNELSGSGIFGKHTDEIENVLRPIFAALEKDKFGRVGHNAARYALHRLFMQRYRWFIRGLDPRSKAPGKKGLDAKVDFTLGSNPKWPSFFQEKLEQLRGGTGLSMHDIASLAAAMEDLVSRESRSRLTMAFDTHGHLQDAVLNQSVMKEIVDDYAVLYMSAWNMKNLTSEVVMRTEMTRFQQGYWKESWAPWLEKLIDGHVGKANESSRDTSFTALEKVGEAIGKGFHKINDDECGELKGVFMSFESNVPGRVRLSDFYGKSVVKKWAFREKPEYLRAMGALDETNKSDPKVIYTNYITSMPQCVPVSSLYSVCCPNECETMLDKLESRIVAPGSDPEHIAKLVSFLSSSTVSAPRNLSESLLARLHEIAAVHGGWVPLHGRLFALWMHHAFPRDCPYPHQSGHVSPLTADEWMQETDSVDTQATEAEMRKHATAERSCPPEGCGEELHDQLPWDDLEELLHHTAPNHTQESSVTAADLASDAGQNPLIYRDMMAQGADAVTPEKRMGTEPVSPKTPVTPKTSDIPNSDTASNKQTHDADRSRVVDGEVSGSSFAGKKQSLAEVSVKQIPEERMRGEAELERLLQESEKFIKTSPGQSSSFGWTLLRAVFVGILALVATVVLRTVLKTQAAKKKQVYYDDASSDKFV